MCYSLVPTASPKTIYLRCYSLISHSPELHKKLSSSSARLAREQHYWVWFGLGWVDLVWIGLVWVALGWVCLFATVTYTAFFHNEREAKKINWFKSILSQSELCAYIEWPHLHESLNIKSKDLNSLRLFWIYWSVLHFQVKQAIRQSEVKQDLRSKVS